MNFERIDILTTELDSQSPQIDQNATLCLLKLKQLSIDNSDNHSKAVEHIFEFLAKNGHSRGKRNSNCVALYIFFSKRLTHFDAFFKQH